MVEGDFSESWGSTAICSVARMDARNLIYLVIW